MRTSVQDAFKAPISVVSILSGHGNGTPGTTITATEHAGVVRQTVLTLSGVALATTDAGASGAAGSVKLYDLPAGLIGILGCTCSLSLAASAGIGAGATVNCGIGSAAAGANDALTGSEQDIVPGTAVVLAAGNGMLLGRSTAGPAVLDGTGAAKSVHLNIAMADAASTANSTITVSGTVTITWVNLGDV